MPEGDTLHRTAAGLRPYLVGRAVVAARAAGPGAGPQVGRIVGATVTDVEAVGKNLLVRFDNGLELRTHLRMTRLVAPLPAGRAVATAAVAGAASSSRFPGAVAVCFDAPVVELLETRAEGLHPPLAGLGPGPARPGLGPRPAAEALRRLRDPARAGRTIGEALVDQRALAGIGNVYKSEVLFIERVDPWARVGELPDATLDALVATARGLLVANADRRAGPERVTTGRARAAAGQPLWVYDRAGRPCRRCGTPIGRRRQGTELPRLTFWCPRCQGGG